MKFQIVKRFFFLLLLLTALSWLSCKKPAKYPDVPTLEFKSLSLTQNAVGLDSKYKLTCVFTDGDGDIGYYNDEANGAIFDSAYSPYYSNLVVKLFFLKNNVWIDDTAYNQFIVTRIPYLTPEGENKSLKGYVDKTEDLPVDVDDTIHFEVFIYDRALHKSNVVTSPDYVIKTY